MKQRSYEFGRSTLTLKFADITTSDAAIAVSSADALLSMGGGVSRSIRQVQALPAAAKPVVHRDNSDDSYLDILRGLKRTIADRDKPSH